MASCQIVLESLVTLQSMTWLHQSAMASMLFGNTKPGMHMRLW